MGVIFCFLFVIFTSQPVLLGIDPSMSTMSYLNRAVARTACTPSSAAMRVCAHLRACTHVCVCVCVCMHVIRDIGVGVHITNCVQWIHHELRRMDTSFMQIHGKYMYMSLTRCIWVTNCVHLSRTVMHIAFMTWSKESYTFLHTRSCMDIILESYRGLHSMHNIFSWGAQGMWQTWWYTCIFTHTPTYIYIYIYIHIYIYIYMIYMYLYIYIYIYMHQTELCLLLTLLQSTSTWCTCICICAHTCMYVYVCMYMYIFTHTPLCIHTLIHRKPTASTWRPTGCLIFIGHFPQKNPIINGSFAENDRQLKASYRLHPLDSCSLSPSTSCIYMYLFDICMCIPTQAHAHTYTYICTNIIHCRPTMHIFGVATISRLLKIIGLFCKRAL